MKEKIRLAYIGVGARGMTVLSECFLKMKDVEISSVCDIVEERCQSGVKKVLEIKGYKPFATTDFKEAILRDDVDAVVFMNGWLNRVEMASFAMKNGKYTAIEVGGAYDINECYKLVEVQEKTGVPLMLLENCCYGRVEMMALRLAKEGLFGEISHCSGGYCHYLPDFFFDCADSEHNFRIDSFSSRNCDFYPTHGLGPVSKILNINKGNRMLTLSSFSSKAMGMKYTAQKRNNGYSTTDFKQGDIITTVITCAGGETIRLTLDTILPRPYYSRDFEIRGTKGMYTEARHSVYFEGMKEGTASCDNEQSFFEKYDHPLHKEFMSQGPKGGHGGMDWLVCRAFVDSFKYQTPPPIDVYDAALWMAITPLSEMSIARGGAPVDIPDFTKGKWLTAQRRIGGKYSLDLIEENKNIGVFDSYEE